MNLMAIDANVWKRKIVNIYLFLLLSLPWLVSLEQFVASHSLPLALLSEPPSTTPARLEVLSAAHIGTTSSSPRHWLNDKKKKKNRNILHSVLGETTTKTAAAVAATQCHVPLTRGGRHRGQTDGPAVVPGQASLLNSLIWAMCTEIRQQGAGVLGKALGRTQRGWNGFRQLLVASRIITPQSRAASR